MMCLYSNSLVTLRNISPSLCLKTPGGKESAGEGMERGRGEEQTGGRVEGKAVGLRDDDKEEEKVVERRE